MCLGVPLQVIRVDDAGRAHCSVGDGEAPRVVDTLLLDQPPRTGQWLLVHVHIAIRTLGGEEAMAIRNALTAVTSAARGEAYEHLIADLVDREPELPDHLKPKESVA